MPRKYKDEADEARALAKELVSGLAGNPHAGMGRRTAKVLKVLANMVESQAEQLATAHFALKYYQDPEQFTPNHPDAGLRARASLAAIGSPKFHPGRRRKWTRILRFRSG